MRSTRSERPSRRCARRFRRRLIVVADDGSRDATARLAAAAGAHVVALARRGKGQALTLGEKSCPPGHLLLVDADLRGDLTPLLESNADLAIAAFRRRSGDGLGIAKRAARRLIVARSGLVTREPLSGQRALTPRARAALFPVAAGFGVETRMTIDAVRAGLEIEEVELDLEHRATRSRSRRLRASRPPAGRPCARLRPSGDVVSWAPAAADRGDHRCRTAGGGAGHARRPRG